MIRGITPMDAALEVMGMHQAQAIMHLVFVQAWGGRILFVLGFILSFVAGLEKGNFRPVLVFVFMFFVVWFLLVVPCVKGSDPVSAMERHGYKGIKAADILRKNGYVQVKVNPVLDTALGWLDTFIISVTAVLDHDNEGHGYLSNPFLMVKMALVLQHRLDQGIVDHQLETKLVRFYQDYYWPLLQGEIPSRLWPGDPDLLSLYSEEGRNTWAALRDDLYAMLNKDGLPERMFAAFYDGKVDQDALVHDLLVREVSLKPVLYTHMAYEENDHSERNFHADLTTRLSLNMLEALPYIHGGILFIMLIMFPFCLSLSLLLRQVDPAFFWLISYISVKAWTIGWAVLDKLSVIWFQMNQAGQGVWLWQASPSQGVVLGIMVVACGMTAGMILLACRVRK
ncbi:MAG: hypothetical protein V2A70_06285 [Candidatus Omnitrophota bacterium]